MTVSLQKGGNVSLTKVAPNLKKIAVGLGWDVRQTGGPAFDLDASAFMLDGNGKLPSDKFFVYYGNLKSPEHSVVHQGDNLTGEGEGDDEVINIDLAQIPSNINKIVFTVTIYQAEQRKQHFGMVDNTFIRVIDVDNTSASTEQASGGGGFMGSLNKMFGGSSSGTLSGTELTRYNLAEKFDMETSMIFGELYRYNDEWKFRAVGQGFKGGLKEMKRLYA